MTILNKQ